MANIHPTAALGFAAGAASYAAGRPDYPPQVGNWLTHELGLSSGKTALDLGAGTGKFSPFLLATGATVVAVEPVPAMLEQLIRQYPEVQARSGSAESLPVADASIDAVVCAQSFHWFATSEALAEIRRVLKPGGAFGLIWNVRDVRVPWVAELTRIIQPFESDVPRFHSGRWRTLFPAAGFGPLRESSFTYQHTGPAERVIIERMLSISFIAALSAEQREQVTAQLRSVIASSPDLAGEPQVAFPYQTVAFACTRQG